MEGNKAATPPAVVVRQRSLLGDGAWIVSGQVLGAVATLAGNRAITEVVAPAAYGAASLLQNIIALARSATTSPILNSGFRLYADAELGGQVPALRARLVALLLRVLPWLTLLVIAATFITTAPARNRIPIVLLMVGLLMADTWRQLEVTMLSAARRQRAVAALFLVEFTIRPLATVLLASLLGGSEVVVLGGVLFSLLLVASAVKASGRAEGAMAGTNPRVGPTPSGMSELSSMALHLAPGGLMMWLMSVSDRYIIQALPHGPDDVGIYSAGYGLVSQPFIMLSGVLAAAFRPVWFSAASRGDASEARRHFSLWLVLAAIGAAAGCLLTWLLAPWAVRTFLGPDYRAAVSVIPWIAAGYFFFCLQQVVEGQLMAGKRARAVLVASAVAATTSIAVTIPLVRHFGYMGAAYACPVYFAVHFAASWTTAATLEEKT